MDWQLLLVAVIVSLALFYLGRQTLRTWRGKGSGCGGCKGSVSTNAETLIPIEQVKLRRR